MKKQTYAHFLQRYFNPLPILVFGGMLVLSGYSLADPSCFLTSMMTKDKAIALYGFPLEQLGNPFQLACQQLNSPGDLERKSQLTTSNKWLLKNNQSEKRVTSTVSNHAVPFLKKILSRVKSAVLVAKIDSENLTICLRESKCRNSQFQNFLGKELPAAVSVARENLAVGLSEDPDVSIFPTAVRNVLYGTHQLETPNFSLDSLGLYKAEPWSKLAPQEIQKANENLNIFQQRAKTTSDSLTALELKNFYNKILIKKNPNIPYNEKLIRQEAYRYEMKGYRHRAFLNYMEIQSRYPILQYLKSNSTTINEVNKANYLLRLNQEKELQFLNKIEAELNNLGPNQSPSSFALQIMNYNSYVELELLQSPQDCVTAKALMYNKKFQESDQSISLAYPILIASIYSGASSIVYPSLLARMYSSAISVGVTGASMISVQNDFDKVTQQNIFAAKKDDDMLLADALAGEQEERLDDPLTAAKEQRNISMYGSLAVLGVAPLLPQKIPNILVSNKAASALKVPFNWALQQKTLLPLKSLKTN